MVSNLITLVKLSTVHLFVDTKHKIITFDVLNSTYSKENSIIVLEYFKNFWALVKEQNAIYYLIIKINSIGVYPLSFYNNLVKCLMELNSIFQTNLHSCAFLCNDDSLLSMLKPLFSMYKSNRPFTICNNYEDIIVYFNKPENNLSKNNISYELNDYHNSKNL